MTELTTRELSHHRARQFPLGDSIALNDLNLDPYPHYHRLRTAEPVSWVNAVGMYLVTRYEDVQTVLRDTVNFATGTEHSLLFDTFGEHMLTTESEQHNLYKTPLLPTFRPGRIREFMGDAIVGHADSLIDEFCHSGEVELRSAYASRLPIKTVLSLFGLPQSDESLLRKWYGSFEAGLANFTWDPTVRAAAQANMRVFHEYLQRHIEAKRRNPDGLLLDQLLQVKKPRTLRDEEVRCNAAIIFFGGISTVEALILNTVYTLHTHPTVLQRLTASRELMQPLLEEVVRWLGPVQSATRHVSGEVVLNGVTLQPGDTVNCMLGAANRDPAVFDSPDEFNIDRDNLRRHLGFAIGSHHCLGSHLAKLEAGIAIARLLERFPAWRFDPQRAPVVRGYEFRQPPALQLLLT